MTCEALMRASGDTRTPLFIDLTAVAVNIVLAPILIYGWLGVPAMGIAGAAWATVIAQAVMVSGYLVCARRGHPAIAADESCARECRAMARCKSLR